MNIQKSDAVISFFEKLSAVYYEDSWAKRKLNYQSFTKDKLLSISEDEFFEYISILWLMLVRVNKNML